MLELTNQSVLQIITENIFICLHIKEIDGIRFMDAGGM